MNSDADSATNHLSTSEYIEELITTLIEMKVQYDELWELTHDFHHSLKRYEAMLYNITLLSDGYETLLRRVVAKLTERQRREIFPNSQTITTNPESSKKMIPIPTDAELDADMQLVKRNAGIPSIREDEAIKSRPIRFFYRRKTISCKYNYHHSCRIEMMVPEMEAGIICTCECHDRRRKK